MYDNFQGLAADTTAKELLLRSKRFCGLTKEYNGILLSLPDTGGLSFSSAILRVLQR